MRPSSSPKAGWVFAFIPVIFLAVQASAAVIRVKPGGDDGNSGASWALAKKTVAAAIAAANEGDEIWVAAGTYVEHIKNRVLNEATDPVPINVALYGGFGGTETALSQRNWKTNLTVLDGGGGPPPTPPATGCVVTISGGASRATRIDGFVITNGHALLGGGGIAISLSGPTIINNTITVNYANIGGGIGILNYDFVPPTTAQPLITNNIITDNYAYEGGGGIAVVGSETLVTYDPAAPVITNNTISRNVCESNGGGIASYGHASLYIENNYIIANAAAHGEENAETGGGGIYATSRDLDGAPIAYAVCAPSIIGNAITANGGYLGAGIYCWDTDVDHGGIPVITNNTVMANNGIAIYWKTTSPVMKNNLVVFNPWGLQQPADAPTSPTISHNCVYGNYFQGQRTDYVNIADQTGVSGNISADPSLANFQIGDFRLQPNSPCISAGLTGAVSPDAKDIFGKNRVIGSGVDIGADESDGTDWHSPTPIIHVRPGGNDAQDGLSWATAKKTAGGGIAKAAVGGGEVWIAAGTYTERNILPAFVYLYGGFAGTETDRDQRNITANATILDGGGVPNVIRVERAGYLISAVDGFTIQNGGTYTNGVLPGPSDGYGGRGGGIYIHVSSPHIENNIITHNSLGNPHDNANKLAYGAGIYTYMFFGLIKGNTITENECLNFMDGSGAGIYCNFSMPTVEANTITSNHSDRGSAFYCEMSIPRIVRNLIENNGMYHNVPSYYDGSGHGTVDLVMGENFLIENNLIRGNTAAVGAGIEVSTNTAGRIQNNLIINNTAWDYSGFGNGGMGGGIYMEVPNNATDYLYILNNTIVGNTATLKLLSPPQNEQGGGIAIALDPPMPPPPTPPPAKLVIANNIIAFNSSGIWQYPMYPMLVPTLVKNDVYGSTSGTGGICNYISLSPGATDISADPVFVNKAGGDFHIQTTSPCKDAGDNSLVPSTLTTDFDGNPRIIDGNADGTATVDMGAYEFGSGTDTTAPTVTITIPTSDPTFPTSQAVINLGGTASDNVGVTSVVWSNDRGGSGQCIGTTSWIANGILLYPGQNIITVTASDHYPNGNTGSDVITVTYTPTPLTISGYVKSSGGVAVSGVVMGGLPGNPATDATGYYTGTVTIGWSGTVTPSKASTTFTPPSRAYTDLAANQTNQDYVASGPAVPSITVTSPNGGESWLVGSAHNITWTSTGTIANVKIEYSTNSGSSYTTIIASTPNDGTHPWTIPSTSSTTCLVRISDAANAATFDVSNAVFTITAVPTITVTSPNGGESWLVGSAHNITWTSAGTITNVKIEYSTNSGSSYTTIIASTPNDGTHPWTIPNTPSTTCLVRISDAANAATVDVSNAVFTIAVAPTVTVTAPNGGESWAAGSSHNITWTSAGGVGNVKIEYSTNGGSSYTVIIASTTNNGSYSWLVPNTPSMTCLVRVSETDGSPSDTSDATFTITAGGGGGFNSPSNHIVLPECIWAPATGGGTWVSEVQVTDVTGGSTVSAYFSSGAGSRRGPIQIWTNPGGERRSVKFSNLLLSLASLDSGFTYYGKVGTVEFVTQDTSHFIQAGARTLNGDYSKTFPGLVLTGENTAAVARPMMIQNFTFNTTYRSTCGFFNPTADALTVEFRLFWGNGVMIGAAFTKTFVGYDFKAFSPFYEAGVTLVTYNYDNIYLLVNPTSGTGSLVCFGASANNNSNDPAAHLAVQYQGTYANSPSNYIVLPECIWAPATGGGTWMSQVQITDLTGGSVVSAYFSYGGGLRQGPVAVWTNSGGAGWSTKFANFLSSMGGIDTGFTYYGRVGTVEFMTQDAAHKIQVAARTLNGDYSKTFPGLALVDSNTADTSREMIIQNYTNNATYRSTCGFFNPTADSVTVEFRLYSEAGILIGSAFTKTFVGHDFKAFSPFNEAGVPYPGSSYDNVILSVKPTTGLGKVVCFGASANNTSNDPAAHMAVQYK